MRDGKFLLEIRQGAERGGCNEGGGGVEDEKFLECL